MKASSYILIPATQFGVEQENYNGIDLAFSGVPVKAAGYYSRFKDLHTVSWHLLNFVGSLVIEATLDEDPSTDNYFPVTNEVLGTGITPNNDNTAINIEGKFTWIRASVTDFTAGAITKVVVGY